MTCASASGVTWQIARTEAHSNVLIPRARRTPDRPHRKREQSTTTNNVGIEIEVKYLTRRTKGTIQQHQHTRIQFPLIGGELLKSVTPDSDLYSHLLTTTLKDVCPSLPLVYAKRNHKSTAQALPSVNASLNASLSLPHSLATTNRSYFYPLTAGESVPACDPSSTSPPRAYAVSVC